MFHLPTLLPLGQVPSYSFLDEKHPQALCDGKRKLCKRPKDLMTANLPAQKPFMVAG
jgi:hypothetical protein